MPRNRLTRALAVLVLIVAQAAFGLPHRMVAGQAVAHSQATAADMGHGDCHHGDDAGNASHSKTPMPPCGHCPASMPGACTDMGSCGASSASPSASPHELLATDIAADFAPAISAPAAHEFIPEPPPPRA